MVRSMQLMSDDARSLGVEIAEQGAAQLQVILDHIKDVVLTANVDGIIDRANPMSERVFGYSPAELLGLRIDALVPEIAAASSIAAGLDRLAGTSDTFRGMRACTPEVTARRSDGSVFPGGDRRQPRASRPQRSLRHLPARHLRAARHRGGAARQRGALPLAGRQRARGHRGHRRGDAPLRRGQRFGAAPVQDDPQPAADQQRRRGQRRIPARRAAVEFAASPAAGAGRGG